ncbi:outer membrane beta-barrel protein [Thermocrinis albus]|nr:outer membrane beta-barrel protein [Thermocrinis albus]
MRGIRSISALSASIVLLSLKPSFSEEKSFPLLANTELRISGGISAFWMQTLDRKENPSLYSVTDISAANLEISKPSSSTLPIGFALNVGRRAVPTVGIEYEPFVSESKFELQSAYITLDIDKLNIMAGKIPAIYGWESPFTYQNANIQRGLVWWAEFNSFFNGFRLTYSLLDTLKVIGGVNDWNTKDGKYALEFGISSRPLSNLLANFTLIYNNRNDKYPIRLYSLALSYSKGNTTITLNPDIITVPDSKTGTNGNGTGTGFGVALFISQKISENLSTGIRFEYVKADKKFDYYGIGKDNSAVTSTFTLKYSKSGFFIRGEASYVKTDKPTYERNKDTQFRLLAETGFVF